MSRYVKNMQGSGTSHYRQVEPTVHLRPFERNDLNISYVWSRARGDLNALGNVFVPFEQPVIRANVYGTLPSDVSNRLVAWGLLQLPLKLALSPVADVHTGLPFSKVDVLQNYVETPKSARFPAFFSLDIRIYRDFELRAPFLGRSKKGRKLRLGVYSLNLTDHRNPHDVYTNMASPLFGKFAGYYGRIDGLVLDIVN